MNDAEPQLILVRNLSGLYDTRRQHARAALRGEEHRVVRGAYVSAAEWGALPSEERYLLRVRAIAATRRTPPVLSHWSAAAVHGLPRSANWPDAVHVTVAPRAAARARNGVVTHAVPLDTSEVVSVDGMLVTTVERTVVDLGACDSFREATVVADRALYIDGRAGLPPLTTRERLVTAWDRRLPFIGHRRSRAVIDFAETGAATPIESLSRVAMHEIGCPRPALQVPFYDADGFIGDTDFAWPELGLAAEADGARKYLDASSRGGRSPERVVLDEKLREDRLRAVLRGFTRWPWVVAIDPARLRRRLTAIGLPMKQPW